MGNVYQPAAMALKVQIQTHKSRNWSESEVSRFVRFPVLLVMIMLSAMRFEPKTRTLRVERLLILTTHPQCWHAQGAAAPSGIGNPGLTIWTRVFLFSFQIYDFVSGFKIIITFSKNIQTLAEFTLGLPKKKKSKIFHFYGKRTDKLSV
jgi:hypothetical protein